MATRSAEREEFLADIITTAVEGGTGYWAQVSQYQYVMDGEVHVYTGERVGDKARAVLHRVKDDESGYEDEGLVVDVEVIAKGLNAILTGKVGVNASTLEYLKRGNAELDAGDVDSTGADCIVQAGLFGEVVYG